MAPGDHRVGGDDGEPEVGGVERAEPALNENQQKKRMMVPMIAIGILWPGKARAVPSFLNLPMRGPMTIAPASAIMPPME